MSSTATAIRDARPGHKPKKLFDHWPPMRTLQFLVFFYALAVPALADILTGRVVKIADGDTLTLLDTSNTQHKIRLSGIDAPERGQAFGSVSGDNLGKLVFGKQVTVEYGKRDGNVAT